MFLSTTTMHNQHTIVNNATRCILLPN